MKTKNTGVSQRKEHEIRIKKKRMVEAIKKAIDNLVDKMDRGDTLRDEDLRFLKTMFKEWPALEESLAEEKDQEELPEGALKTFVERTWVLRGVGDLNDIIEKTGYYRCSSCGEIHIAGRKCMYEEFKDKYPSKDARSPELED